MGKLISQVIKTLERQVPKYSKVGNSVFFTNDQFPWSYTLEANWKVIREELDEVMEHTDALPNFQDISPRQHRIANDNRWKTYFFWAFGFKSKVNCDRCPETTKLLKKIPGLKVAFFSILAPGKHIPEHYGKHKGLIRYHLGLKVPEPREKCRIRVADQYAHWEEGKSLIFDDTYMHEVWNDTDGYRAVLFLDIARPMRFPMNLANAIACSILALSPVVQVARGNHESWEKQFEKMMR
ncbi:aspartyl/asparaginyl beta-hydroxylase domain-containing protein [Oscillatoria sp. FACHB-1407]|uniref:aspartyl/asparaginyl beta-hydroxylase domain-containing protein n=1 Tax=Oscillatoria sp. FACHB-1407 TaxID=2692847 RepID=UPI001689B5E6|nr:aspartyl/asparaginyl beta-hydroxylase domain-containing protein [Oscillatoria sp. FACHB-1407]MBD2462548.1 aspartyl/asparaginyl beta-hydroxylase domain-containing protein [Oscillatoria sp. FACHB-1407]